MCARQFAQQSSAVEEDIEIARAGDFDSINFVDSL